MSWARRHGAPRALILTIFFSLPVAGAFLSFIEVFEDGVDGVDGLLRARAVTVSPDGRNVYVAGHLDNAVAIFSRSEFGGPLTYAGLIRDNGVDVFLDGPTGLAVSADGGRLFASTDFDNSLAVFSRDATSDALAQIAVFQDGVGSVDGLAGASSVARSADGQHVYVTGRDDFSVAIFSRDATTEDVVFAGLERNGVDGVAGLAGASAVAVSPDGDMVLATGEFEDSLVVFARDATSDDLVFVETLVDGFDGVADLRGPVDVEFSSDGQDVYVASQVDSRVTLFHRVASSVEYVTSYPVPFSVNGLALSNDGRLLVASAGAAQPSLEVFTRDAIDGTLTLVETIEDGVGGVTGLHGVVAVAFSPDDSELYTAAILADAMVRFQNDAVVNLFADGFESGDASAWSNVSP